MEDRTLDWIFSSRYFKKNKINPIILFPPSPYKESYMSVYRKKPTENYINIDILKWRYYKTSNLCHHISNDASENQDK